MARGRLVICDMGGVHGLGQIVSNVLYRKDRKKLPAFVGIVFTFLFCMIGWVFFRAANIGDAAYWFSNCLAEIGRASCRERV